VVRNHYTPHPKHCPVSWSHPSIAQEWGAFASITLAGLRDAFQFAHRKHNSGSIRVRVPHCGHKVKVVVIRMAKEKAGTLQ